MTIFAKTVAKEGRIPFELSLKTPNRETIETMLEVERLSRVPKTKRFSNFMEMINKYSLILSSRFKKDLKQCVKRNLDIS
jgi:antitoxin component of RelBE/YafQ-DinJ toxin-antitoxin module